MIESLSIVRPSVFGRRAGITAGLSTRAGGPDGSPFGMNLSFSVGDEADHVRRNRTLFFGALGIGMHELAFMRQVHGSTVTRVESPGVYPACDGMITDVPRLFLSVTVADCVPVFILDPAVHALAVVHAGWRGTAAHIIGKAVEALGVAYGGLPSRMEAFVGPAAGGCCYEVGADVAGAIDPAFVTERNGRLFADLKACNTAQLRASGVPEMSIESHPGCTIHEKTLFQSFRRDGSQSGRMIGVAGFSAES
jgi:polyphenol oxidase